MWGQHIVYMRYIQHYIILYYIILYHIIYTWTVQMTTRRRSRGSRAGRRCRARRHAQAAPGRPGGAMCRALSCRILAPGPLAIIMPRIVTPCRLGGAVCRAGGGWLVLPYPGTGRGGAVRRRSNPDGRMAPQPIARDSAIVHHISRRAVASHARWPLAFSLALSPPLRRSQSRMTV